MPELTPVQQFYKDKTIFITGASGFMGKVLLEKLLYSCSELKEIIILMRPKRGKTPESRLEDMWKLPMFQRMRDEKPHLFKKVTMVAGDITMDYLGLTGETLKHVTDETNIVFHMAASLRLEADLKYNIDMNLNGTKRAMDVAKQMKKLVAFIHLSTAFCNCDIDVMHEKIYEFRHKPEDLMRMGEWMDKKMLDAIQKDLLEPHPNTYTYSKRLAEIYVRDHYPAMPVVVTRPSIVSPSAYEPVPGWVDNLNGPTGLMVGAAKGVIRSMLIDETCKSEVIPVDYAINGLITIAYEFATEEKPETVPVYNITCAEHRKQYWGDVIKLGKKIGYQYPLSAGLWYPDGCITTNRLHHNINVLLFHWLPAYIIDFILLVLGQKRFMLRVQNRVQIGLGVLQFFSMTHWKFRSDKYDQLWKKLNDTDKKIFNMDMNPKESIEEYMMSCVIAGRLYLMKESPDTLPSARRQLAMMYVLDRACKTFFYGYVAYYLMKFTVSPAAFEPLPGWVDNLNGPTGIMVGAAKGVIRSMLIDESIKGECIPVDYAINGLITIAYEFATMKQKPQEIPVYNVTCAEHRKRTWGEVIHHGKKIGYEYPLEIGLWYPDGVITTNRLYHRINCILFHWVPAYFIDFLLLIFGQKRFMLRVADRVATGLEVLQFFTMRPWHFTSEKYQSVWKKLGEKDKAEFNQDMDNPYPEEEYLIAGLKGGRQWIMKEPLETLPKARRQLKIAYFVDRTLSPAAFEPLPGWVDNLNGPTGLMIGAAKGVIRSMLVNGRYKSEVIPVDYAINGLITIAYEFATLKEKPESIPVYNMTCPEEKKVTWKFVMDLGKKIGYEHPFEAGLWYPDGNITTNYFVHMLNVILFMWIPAYLIDFLLLIAGQKRFMVRVQTKIADGLDVLQFFTTREWNFKSTCYEQVSKNLTEADREIFNQDAYKVEEESYMRAGILGGRQYILKEPLSSLPKARIQLKIQYIVDRLCKALILGLTLYWIYKRITNSVEH
ncbi:uncharacterized protein LOC129607522 [Condylostylus longicornis]|uniref:uncharacterized protein LOC129607522 n=1 Tax=Condylostylus longicornis TaxID=2530218 RepID=UPI00244E1D02|nr:uncharacterized protein LOC129607522 [Condylostylus longicornis]